MSHAVRAYFDEPVGYRPNQGEQTEMGIQRATLRNLSGSALIGVASGYLSMTGVATLLTVTPQKRLPGFLRSPWVSRGAQAIAGGEWFGNAFLTSVPSRTSPPLLAGRIAFGAASAALLARSRGRSIGLPVVIGGAGGALGSKVSHDSRAVLARHVPDPLVGWAENALAAGLSVAATRK